LTLQMVRGFAADGMTTIMTTHDPNHALWLGGRVALMKDGRSPCRAWAGREEAVAPPRGGGLFVAE
jgi:ABC-type cobalamin/Fe3+-siderophores transport system ATPase subunit